MPATTVFLVRHGEADAAGRFCGRFDPPLTPLGRRQVRECAAGLRGVPLAAVYASPLRRSRDTAAALGFARIQHNLIERHFGAWEGRELATLPELDLRRLWTQRHFAPPGGESMQALERRALHTFTRIAKKHAQETLAVVAHGGLIRAALSGWLGISLPGVMALDLSPGHATLVQYYGDGGVRVAGVNLPPTTWHDAWSNL